MYRVWQVKVPAGKHCGFVQFVKKADAERAIEKMQGFPVGGSRIRPSWGRSQYKAAQVAAQAALQSAAANAPPQLPSQSVSSPVSVVIPQAQAAAVSAGANVNINANPNGTAMMQGLTQEMPGYTPFPVPLGVPNAYYAAPPNGYVAPAPTNANANVNTTGCYVPPPSASIPSNSNGGNNGTSVEPSQCPRIL
ncbi:hypothetical protein B0H14DRAFT_2569309 [Mycena olivaceomarginata]|nr:hypothetical protein B0H14DRAFT_2569309 [Mycena olivaceomarginata]